MKYRFLKSSRLRKSCVDLCIDLRKESDRPELRLFQNMKAPGFRVDKTGS